MVTRSTHHAHTTYVDGRDTPRQMIEAALKRGFVSIGLSEHARQPFDPAYGMKDGDEGAYVRDVLALKAEYAGRIAVWLGIEQDQYAAKGDYPYDYVIGSKHYVTTQAGLQAVDGAFSDIRAMVEGQFRGDWVGMAQVYFSELAQFVCRERPQVIGHFDLVSKFNEGGKVFDPDDARYIEAGCAALDRMARTGALLEVNTGAIGRGYRKTPYPAPVFLKTWRELGGGVILGSDCHDASWIDVAYDRAEAAMRQAGYEVAYRLGQRQLFEAYSLT